MNLIALSLSGLSSSSSIPSPSDPPSPSPSSAYSSGSVPDPMDSASSPSSPLSVPPPADALFLMDYETASPPAPPPPHSNTMSLHSELADELLDYSENAENEDFLSADVLQVCTSQPFSQSHTAFIYFTRTVFVMSCVCVTPAAFMKQHKHQNKTYICEDKK